MQNKLLKQTSSEIGTLLPLFLRHLMDIGRSEGQNNLSRAHIDLLFLLDTFDYLKMTQIADMLSISKPYVTTLVDKLISLYLVERQPSPKDRRVIYICLTQQGRTYIHHYKKANLKVIESKLATLDEGVLEELFDSLKTLKSVFLTTE